MNPLKKLTIEPYKNFSRTFETMHNSVTVRKFTTTAFYTFFIKIGLTASIFHALVKVRRRLNFLNNSKMDIVSSFAQFLRTTAGKLSGLHDIDTSNDPRISTTASSVTVKLLRLYSHSNYFCRPMTR